jgi:hypothetical protein
MKVGDLVKWVGFPGATIKFKEKYGIIISKKSRGIYDQKSDYLDVLWDNGRIGKMLYPQTIEVVSED